ncbi:type II toxin-antitoxin system VapC family toxin [Terracidiphilus sp.]|jgi:predicted nucleic acid-binding protein|uniref:type II toxin-antitoxin system VapC family toxin n=1 Tax=Terracidiphilus sp. TaxID=1964191 RepID=UPI003C20B8FD
MVIVDSSVLIDYLAGRLTPQTEWLLRSPDSSRIGITSLILSEVLQGVRSDDAFPETLRILQQFAVFETGGRELAIASARNYRELRKLGFTIRSTIDCITATFCIEEGHTLLHNDRDFTAFENHLHLETVRPVTLN